MGDDSILSLLIAQVEKIEKEFYKSFAYSEIAAAAAQLGDTTLAINNLKQAVSAAEKIENESDKSAYRSILGDDSILSLLIGRKDRAESSKSFAYRAAAAGQLGDTTLAINNLKQAVLAAEKIENESIKSAAYREIAAAAGQPPRQPANWEMTPF